MCPKVKTTMTAPEGLTELEYARHILEEQLGWPAKGNLELVADCIRAVAVSRRIPAVRAHSYMLRALKLAKEQGIEVTRMWFMNGDYTHMRPAKENVERKTCPRCRITNGFVFVAKNTVKLCDHKEPNEDQKTAASGA